jgi:hypothetical protein
MELNEPKIVQKVKTPLTNISSTGFSTFKQPVSTFVHITAP